MPRQPDVLEGFQSEPRKPEDSEGPTNAENDPFAADASNMTK